jgi:hypothetical protein
MPLDKLVAVIAIKADRLSLHWSSKLRRNKGAS